MKKLFFTALYTMLIITAMAQTDREFWFVAPEVTTTHQDFHTFGSKEYRGGEPVFLRISTRELASTVTIEMPANAANFTPITVNIPANSTYSLNLTDYAKNAQIENMYNGNGYNNKGIHITATELITCYYEVATPNNTDLFALKGKNALGTEFFTPFQTMSDNNNWWGALPQKAIDLGEQYAVPAYSAIHIVATKDNTTIQITPSKTTFDGKPAGAPYLVTLQKGQTYSLGPKSYIPTWYGEQKTFSYAAADRLAGTYIRSSAPIAVTLSDDSMKFPSNGCYDLSGDQLIPTSIIGHEYIAMRGQIEMAGRAAGKSGEQLYILATKDNTVVKVNGVVIGTINKGKQLMYEFNTTDYAVHVASDELHPIYVMHISGFGCEQGAAILPPTSSCTGSTQIGFTRTATTGFFLNLMVRKDAYDGFILNGTPILTNLSDWTVIPSDSKWVAARVDFTANTAAIPAGKQSLIVNTKDIFHMGIINGTKTGGCRFGYFSDFNKLEIAAITTNTQTPNIRTCWGVPVRLQGTGGTNFHWTPHDYLDDPYSQNPLCKPRENMRYTVSVSGACEMVGTADVTVEVAPLVDADFRVDTAQACGPYEFTLTNNSTGATSENKWDFGDGTPAVNNPAKQIKRTYTNTSDTVKSFVIKLVAKNIESCRDTFMREIFVYPEIKAQFAASQIEGCSPVNVDFTNQSTGARGLRAQLWEFGDGAGSAAVSPSHLYENNSRQDSLYKVRLAVSNQYYCADTAYQDILVHPYIKADFAIAPIVACTPYLSEIENKSVGADTYRWTYGDTQTSTTGDAVHTHNYVNATAATKTYPLKLIVDNEEGCSDTLQRIVTVHPDIKALFTVDKSTVCDNTEIAFTNASTGASSYFWDFGDNSTSAAASPKHTYRNLTNATVKYTARLIVSATNGFCSDTLEQIITVHPFLSAQFNFPSASGCSPYTAKITNTSVGATVNNWNFGDGQTNNFPDKVFDHIYTNNTIATKTYQISLVTENPQGCTQRMDKNITVYPSIKAEFLMSAATVCDSTQIVFTNKSLGASTYEWRFADMGSSADYAPKFVVKNPLSTTEIKQITLIARASNNVCTDTARQNITVYPQVKANFSLDNTAGCTPFTVSAIDASVQASTYTWTMSNGVTLNTKGSITQQFTNTLNTPVDYTISLKVENAQSCSSTITRKVTVYPKVTAQFASTEGCSPHLINNFANTTINASSYEWDFGDNTGSNEKSPSHTFVNFSPTVDQTFTVKLSATSEYGCKDATTRPVKVYYAPQAAFTLGNPRGCAPYNIDISNSSVGAVSYLWDYGDGRPTDTHTDAVYEVTYTNTTRDIKTYPITLTATSNNGCVSMLSRNAVIYPAITAEFVASSGCDPYPITDFKNTSVGASIFDWSFGDGVQSNVQHPTHVFENFSTAVDSVYNVNLKTTSPNGCTATVSKTVTVYPKPDAAFEIDAATGCSPYTVPINNVSKGVSIYDWDMGDTQKRTDATSFTHDYFNSTRAIKYVPITLIGSNAKGCKDTLSRTAVIYPDIKAEFAAISGCHPHTIANFKNTSVGAANYSWDFGDMQTSNEASPSHQFVHFSRIKDTTYKITLTATSLNGCTSVKDTTISVYHKPKAEFSFADNEGCSPHTTAIINASVGHTSLAWDFGDLSTSAELSASFDHTYRNSTLATKQYPLTLIATSANNCKDTMIANATIYPDISAKFTAYSGCHPHSIEDFKPVANGSNILFDWTFGNGQSSNLASPKQLFSNFSNTVDSVYSIRLNVESEQGCTAQYDTTIRVYPKPKAEFLLVNPEGCAPFTVNVTNTSKGAKTLIWDFADGSATESSLAGKLAHPYTNMSGATITFPVNVLATTAFGCTDTMSRNAIIHSQVIVSFETKDGCHPHTISDFKNTTIGTNLAYNWQFGDKQSSNIAKPKHLFSNISNTVDSTYTVNLYAESPYGCKDEKSLTVTVFHKPLAEFSVVNAPICSPDTISFVNKSVGNSQTLWSFGDGTDSVADNKPVVHRYRNSTGDVYDYPVQIIAVTDNSCRDTMSRLAKVFPDITAAFDIVGGCHPHFIQDFKNTSQWVDEYQWTFGDGSSSNVRYPQHLFRNISRDIDSVYTISLHTISRFGCTADTSIDITVKHKPKAEFAILNSPICSPDSIDLSDESIGADTSYWSFGDGLSRMETSLKKLSHPYSHSEADLKLYDIQLISRTDGGCSDTIVRSATIYPTISSLFDAVQTNCSPYTTSFNNYSEGVFSYNWILGNGNNSTYYEPSTTYFNYSNTKDTIYKVSLETTSKYGCRAYSEMYVTVFPIPDAKFSVLNTPGCSPYTINIDNTTTGADIMVWDFADGTTNIDSLTGKFSHPYRNAGSEYQNFPIQMIAITHKGCSDTLTRVATIYPDITSKFNLNIIGCNPLKVKTQNTSIGVERYYWDMGDGATSGSKDFEHTYYNFNSSRDTSFKVSLLTESKYGCKAYKDTIVTVYADPIAGYTVTKDLDCSPFTVPFTNTSKGATVYSWQYDDGSPVDASKSPTHVFTNTSNDIIKRQVKLVVANAQGCKDSVQKTISTYPEVTAEFAMDTAGCHPHYVVFDNQSKLGDIFEWELGENDLRTAFEPFKYFENLQTEPITHRVKLRTTSRFDCWDTISKLVYVYPSPDADFTADPKKQVFPSSDIGKATVNLTDLTNKGNWHYIWKFGNGAISNAVGSTSYDYPTWNKSGERYLIEQYVFNDYGCYDTASQIVVVTSPKPEPTFSISSDNGCPPYTVEFADNSAYAKNVRWYFGDGIESTDRNTSHTYYNTGTYNIVFEIDGDGGISTADTVVEIHQMPILKFTVSNQLLNLPKDTLQLINSSAFGTRYLWEIGDGTVSEEFSPSHYFTTPGDYDIKLTVWTEHGCVLDSIATGAVTVLAPCGIEFPNAFTPNTKEAPNGQWKTNGVDNLKLINTNDIFFPAKLEEGITDMHLEIYNKWGEMIFATDDRYMGWNGYYRGECAKMDVYVWKLTANCADGREITKVGDVTLIR